MKQLCSSSSKHADCHHHSWHTYPWHHLTWTHLHHTFASLQYGHHSNHLNLVNVSLPGTLLTQDSYVSVSIVDSEVFGQVVSAGARLELATTRFHCNLFVANAFCDAADTCPPPTSAPTAAPVPVPTPTCDPTPLPAVNGWIEYPCVDHVKDVPYSQQDLINGAGVALYDAAGPLPYCQGICLSDAECVGFHHHKHANGHEVCAFYTNATTFVNPNLQNGTGGVLMEREVTLPPTPTACDPTPLPAVDGWIEYPCVDHVKDVPYSQQDLINGAGVALYGAAGPLPYCQGICLSDAECVGFHHNKHGNGHEVCAFYTSITTFVNPNLQNGTGGVLMEREVTLPPTPTACDPTPLPAVNSWIEYPCVDHVKDVPYSQQDLINGGVALYGAAGPLPYCQGICLSDAECVGFHHHKHGNGHEVCAFYTNATTFVNPNLQNGTGGVLMEREVTLPPTPTACDPTPLPAVDGWIEYPCVDHVKDVPYSMTYLVDGGGNILYDAAGPLPYCQDKCLVDSACVGFHYHKQATSHEVCGFYTLATTFVNPNLQNGTGGVLMERDM